MLAVSVSVAVSSAGQAVGITSSSGCSRFSTPSLGVFLSWSPPFFNGLARETGKREAI